MVADNVKKAMLSIKLQKIIETQEVQTPLVVVKESKFKKSKLNTKNRRIANKKILDPTGIAEAQKSSKVKEGATLTIDFKTEDCKLSLVNYYS